MNDSSLEASTPDPSESNTITHSEASWVRPHIQATPIETDLPQEQPSLISNKPMAIGPKDRLYPTPNIQQFPVSDEMILLQRDESYSSTIALNHSARTIWELCDGQRTMSDISEELGRRFSNPGPIAGTALATALQQFQHLGLLECSQNLSTSRPPVKLVVGIEDNTYFHWQLAIFIESFSEHLPSGWEILVVICNNHHPLSEALTQIIMTYGVPYFTTTNHPANHTIDFSQGRDRYSAINKIQALQAVADYVQPDDMVCLLDTDIFLYKELNLDVIPTRNTLTKNWIVDQDLFFTVGKEPTGVNLQKLLDALGCATPFQPGGVMIFLTGATIKYEKFVQDCFRWSQILFLMGRMIHVPKVWIAEMPSFALALTVNDIPYDLIDIPEFSTNNIGETAINPGSFFHYYRDLGDGGDGAFHQSTWCKQHFRKKNFLDADIQKFAVNATSDHERYFFELAERTKRRLYACHA